jgi:hypothetical protein
VPCIGGEPGRSTLDDELPGVGTVVQGQSQCGVALYSQFYQTPPSTLSDGTGEREKCPTTTNSPGGIEKPQFIREFRGVLGQIRWKILFTGGTKPTARRLSPFVPVFSTANVEKIVQAFQKIGGRVNAFGVEFREKPGESS